VCEQREKKINFSMFCYNYDYNYNYTVHAEYFNSEYFDDYKLDVVDALEGKKNSRMFNTCVNLASDFYKIYFFSWKMTAFCL